VFQEIIKRKEASIEKISLYDSQLLKEPRNLTFPKLEIKGNDEMDL
jgi:hypothetical protein